VVEVGEVRSILERRDLEEAAKMIQLTMSGAPYTNELVDAQTVGELLYYQGLLPRMMEVQRPEDLDLWRDALVIFPRLAWSKELLDDRDQRAVFEALRGEISQRPAVATGVPKNRGLARTYVDGVEHQHEQAVGAGRHLVQIACPGGDIVGRWTRFDQPVPWLELCPQPLDLTVSPPPAEEEDPFGEMDNPRAGPDPLPLRMVPVAVLPSFSVRWKTRLLIGAGASAVVAGGLYTAALLGRSKYDSLDEGSVQNQADLDALRSTINTQVGLSVVFAGAGLGMATVAGFSGRW
jgi:hypothetical protein